MININNKTLSGIYKNGNEVVKILKNELIVYQKEGAVNPYDSPGVYYHKITGECEKTRSSRNNNDYDGLVISDGTHVFVMSKIVFWNNHPQAASDGPRWIESVYIDGTFIRKEYFANTFRTSEEASQNFDGAGNTAEILSKNYTYPSEVLNYLNQMRTNTGEDSWYIPSAGEKLLVKQYREEVNDKLIDLGVSGYSENEWSSDFTYDSFGAKVFVAWATGDAYGLSTWSPADNNFGLRLHKPYSLP